MVGVKGIHLEGIEKSYVVDEKKVEVLKGINLDIPSNGITVILGKSGCGKTTLLRIIGGLEEYDNGRIYGRENERMTFVFQEPRLMPWLNIWENIKFGLKKEEIDNTKLQSIIDTVGLNDFEKAYPHQLSGGMKQRAAIARALAYAPSFIMMDEPFAALDYFTRRQMQKELLNLEVNRKTSILFVTHSIDEALILADKIVVLEKGRVKEEYIVNVNINERDLLEPVFIELKKDIMGQLYL